MSQPAHSYVQYFISYDGDTEDHPNVFLVKKPQKDLRLSDLQQTFPLPGQYFFRAKTAFGKTHVWLDLNDQNDPVPAFNGKVTVKVSRVSLAGSSAAPVVAASQARPAAAAPAPAVAPVQRAAAPAPSPSAASQSSLIGKPAASPVADHHDDLLGVFTAPSGRPTGGAAAAPSSSPVPAVDPFAAPTAVPQQRPAAAGFVDPFAASGFGAGPRPMGGQGAGMGPAQGQRPGQAGAAAKKPGGSILDGDIFSM